VTVDFRQYRLISTGKICRDLLRQFVDDLLQGLPDLPVIDFLPGFQQGDESRVAGFSYLFDQQQDYSHVSVLQFVDKTANISL
jgi:hypothetical protein